MKKNWRSNIAFLLAIVLVAACSRGDQQAHSDTYTCPMHPTIVSDHQGTCPVCGMDLVRVGRPGEEVVMTEALARLVKSPGESVVASVKTIRGEYKTIGRILKGQGMITYDPRYAFDIPVTTDARIERTFVTYAMQPVKKGQPVAVLYSTALVTAQQELLYLLREDEANSTLIASAKEKLMLLGFAAAQVESLVNTKAVQSSVTIYSPHSGYVVITRPDADTRKAIAAGKSGTMNGSMATSELPAIPITRSLPREGDYVGAGQTLFTVVSADAFRVDINFPATQAGIIAKGDKAHLDFGNNETHHGTVDFVQPFFSEGQQFVNVRFYIPAMKDLHITHLVTATLQASQTESLWVPRQSVVDLGNSEVIFVKNKGAFIPKRIVTGVHNGEWIEIKTGLASSEEIAANAAYLVDSDTSVKPQNE